jgi:hypothetical protein
LGTDARPRGPGHLRLTVPCWCPTRPYGAPLFQTHPEFSGGFNESTERPNHRQLPHLDERTRRLGHEWMGRLCVRLLVRCPDRAHAPERNRTPHKRSDGDGGGTERAGARERRHADRLSRSIRRTHFHLGADCSIGSPDSSGAHGLSTALSVRNGAGTRRARGWRTHTLSSIGSASALSVLCTAHH